MLTEARLLKERRKRIAERYLEPMIAVANRLGIEGVSLLAAVLFADLDGFKAQLTPTAIRLGTSC